MEVGFAFLITLSPSPSQCLTVLHPLPVKTHHISHLPSDVIVLPSIHLYRCILYKKKRKIHKESHFISPLLAFNQIDFYFPAFDAYLLPISGHGRQPGIPVSPQIWLILSVQSSRPVRRCRRCRPVLVNHRQREADKEEASQRVFRDTMWYIDAFFEKKNISSLRLYHEVTCSLPV